MLLLCLTQALVDWMEMTLTFGSSCLHFLSISVAGMCHACFIAMVGKQSLEPQTSPSPSIESFLDTALPWEEHTYPVSFNPYDCF